MKHLLFHRSRRRGETDFEELKKVVNRLKMSPPQTRSAVGAGVQMANAHFLRRFAGFESFRQSTGAQREQLWSELSELELGMRGQEVGLAVGVGLYRIWLADTLAGQRNTADFLGEELAELSRKN